MSWYPPAAMPVMGRYRAMEIWNAIIDGNTCDECRALHGKPISEIGMIPPLHGTNDTQGRTPCRCTIRTDNPAQEGRPTQDELRDQYTRMIAYNARHFKGA